MSENSPGVEAAQIAIALEHKVAAMLASAARTIGRADLEIILGVETDRLLVAAPSAFAWWANQAPNKEFPPGSLASMHGREMLGVSVKVDSATPRLWAVRVRLDRGRPRPTDNAKA